MRPLGMQSVRHFKTPTRGEVSLCQGNISFPCNKQQPTMRSLWSNNKFSFVGGRVLVLELVAVPVILCRLWFRSRVPSRPVWLEEKR